MNTYLSAPALSVLGALDDPGQVEQLDLGALVLDAPGHRRQRRELVSGNLGVHAGQVAQQCRLPHGWRSYET